MREVKEAALPDEVLVSALMASVPDHLYFVDRESRCVSVSRSLAQFLGLSVEDLLGKTAFDFLDEATARTYRERDLNIMRTGKALINQMIKDTWPDGRVKWSLSSFMPLRNGGGEIVGVFTLSKDITAAKLMEEELAKANLDLRDMSRAAGMAEVANNVLQNVGNILNSVNVSAGLIGDKVRDSKAKGLDGAGQLMNEHSADLAAFFTADAKGKALTGYLNKLVLVLASERESIAAELASLTRSIEHIKDIVVSQQTYAGAARLPEPVQIKDLLDDALRMSAASIQRHQITIVKEFAEVPVLRLDKHLMLQILVNLITNAKHAMDGVPDRSHHITLRMSVVGVVDAARLSIAVEDDGEGIAGENLPRLFTRGFTTRKNGHGFGLHSCALAAKQMGGRIADI